ncbi:MAG: ATP-binding cassette domain-containing protein [Streptococcaceae bacterium]|jgi:ABC-2 type transport system ATP-binding protein|nr:ATP-binding cassette domain-containing protein [Streptococcaceae bacterium]
METVLKVNNISKRYGQQYALRDVSMTIQQGEIYGLIGRNGAGKTTLLKLITRLIFATNGSLSLFGSSTDHEWTKSLKRTGAVIESPAAYDNLSAAQNLEYYCKLRGIPDSKKVISETLALVDLIDTGKKKFKSFSLGMKQKLGIAIAILSRPDFLILDEPINGLDPIAIADFRKLVLRLNQERKMTIIISSHILTELYQVATHFGIINQGQLVKEISKDEFDALSEEYIVLKTGQVEHASQLLKDKTNYPFKVVSQDQINVFGKNHQIGEVNILLAQSGIAVDEIYYFKQDLESYFTNLISGDTQEENHHD